MNEDKIEIMGSWKEVDSEEYADSLLLDIQILINGVPVKWNYISPYSLILNYLNHKPKDWPDYEYSAFEPFTCSCGVGGCAGIWDGIYVKVRKHSVEWRCSKRDGYGFMPKTFFSFDRKQYEKAFLRFWGWLRMSSDFDYKLYVDLGHYEGDETTVDDFVEWIYKRWEE